MDPTPPAATIALMVWASSAVAGETSRPHGSEVSPSVDIGDLNNQRYVFVSNRTTAEIAIVDTRLPYRS